jgi:hypothetical protein
VADYKARRIIGWSLALVAIGVIVVLYAIFDPATNALFPKCPFKMLTGLECPGCGSQRAIHRLLNLDFQGAISQNVLVMVAIPYMITGALFDLTGGRSEGVLRWRKRLFGATAIWIILAIIVIFTILRNVPYFEQWL